jgi:hypothetical protein
MIGNMRKFAISPTGLIAVSLLGLAAIYGICYFAPGYGLFDDDGVYLVTAKSLAEGSGYRIVSLPSAIPQTKYPPVFPALLASVWKIYSHFPQNTYALKLVPLFSMLGWLWLSYLLLRRMSVSPPACRSIILLTVAVPWVVCLSVTLMAEMTFACLLSAALLILTRLYEEEKSRTGNVILASVLSGATILTRTAGLPLAFAGALTLLLRRKFRQAFIYSLTTAAMLLPWLAWASHANPPRNTIEAYYSGDVYGTWSLLGNYTWHQRLTVVVQNFYYMLVSTGYFIGGFTRPANWEALFWILLVLLLGFFSLYGFLLHLLRRITPLNLFVLCYAALLLVWVFPPFRFLVPLLPFLLFFCYIAVDHFFGTVVGSPMGAKLIEQCSVIVLVLFLSGGLLSEVQKTMQYRAASMPHRDSYDWNEIVPLSRWIASNTPSDAVLMGNLDPVWFMLSGRKAVRGYVMYPFEMSYSPDPHNSLGTYTEFCQNLLRERPDYLIRTYEGGGNMNRMIDRLASDFPSAVTLQEQGKNSDYRIYRINLVKLTDDFVRLSEITVDK